MRGPMWATTINSTINQTQCDENCNGNTRRVRKLRVLSYLSGIAVTPRVKASALNARRICNEFVKASPAALATRRR